MDNWIWVYMLFSGLGDEHTSWATTVQNLSRKDVEPFEFSTITTQLLHKSRILAKSSAGTDTKNTLIGKQFGKRKFSSTISSNPGLSTKRSSPCSKTNTRKARYKKAKANCTHWNRSYHAVQDCWFLHLEKRRQVGWLVISLRVLNNLSTFWQLGPCLLIW